MVSVEPESGDNGGFAVSPRHEVENGPFDTHDARLFKSEKPALYTNTVNEC